MEDEWPADFEGEVAGIKTILKGWLQNISRNAAGEGITLEPSVIAEALDRLREEYDALIEGKVDDIDEWLKHWSEGGTD